MLGFTDTFSLSDLEEVLDTVDKSTIFRTLEVFAEHHVIHETEDGSGARKYCVCHSGHVCGPEEMHCHFYCESCHKTFCLDHTHIPPVKVPEGYELHEVEYLLKGLCPECRKKAKKNRRQSGAGFFVTIDDSKTCKIPRRNEAGEGPGGDP